MRLYKITYGPASKLVIAQSFDEALRYVLKRMTGPRPAGLQVQPVGLAPKWLKGPTPREVDTLLPAIRFVRLLLPLLLSLGFATETQPPREACYENDPGIERGPPPETPEEDLAEPRGDDDEQQDEQSLV